MALRRRSCKVESKMKKTNGDGEGFAAMMLDRDSESN